MTPFQKLQARAARRFFALPKSLLTKLAGAPVELGGCRLDAEVQLMLKLMRLARVKPPASASRSVLRATMEDACSILAPRAPSLESVVDDSVDGADGPLRARVYTPIARSSRPRSALVFFHGGGWTEGSLDSHDGPCRVLAAKSGCVVLSVDYRLAPEHPFPRGLDDAVAAYRFVARNAARWSLDASRLVVGGDSAGGNLAALVALATRDDAAPPRAQLLIYPATDLTRKSASVATYGKGFYLERPDMDEHVATYLNGASETDPRASPLYATSFAGLPRALVVTCGFDPLKDEGRAYAKAMREAGVDVRELRYESLFHGFINVAGGIREAGRALDEIGDGLRALSSD